MSLPTVSDVQAVETVLTNLLVGYSQADTRFVASKVFPVVNVNQDSGTYYIFTKKYWFLNQMETRAPGSQFARGDYGVETSTYSTVQFGLSYAIADEIRRNSQIPMDLEQAAVRWLSQKSLLKKEIAFSTDFMKTSVWGTDKSVTSKWSDYSASDPVQDILTGKRTVSNNTGVDPNSLVMGYIVYERLSNHPDMIDRIKYTQIASASNVEQALGSVFGVNVLVGKGTYSNTNESASFSASAIIDDDALLCYVTPNPGLFEASAGYTFAWSGAGGAGTIDRYRDEPTKSDIIRNQEQWDQVATATDVGYFFADCVD